MAITAATRTTATSTTSSPATNTGRRGHDGNQALVSSVVRNPGVFRRHETPAAMSSPLLRQLCLEWVDLNAASHALSGVTWAQTQPALAGALTPGDVVDHIDNSSPAGKDQALRCLLALLQDGDRLAGRVLLQSMLPAICDLARRCHSPRGENSYEESLQRVIAEFWTVITEPRHRDRPGVAGRLILDTLHQVTRHRRSSDAWEEHTYLQDDQDHQSVGPESQDAGAPELRLVGGVEVIEDLDPDGGLLELLVWARRTDVLSVAEAAFLNQVFLQGDPDQKATAQRLGLSHASVRQRVSRLRTRLVDAVVADLEHLSPSSHGTHGVAA